MVKKAESYNGLFKERMETTPMNFAGQSFNTEAGKGLDLSKGVVFQSGDPEGPDSQTAKTFNGQSATIASLQNMETWTVTYDGPPSTDPLSVIVDLAAGSRGSPAAKADPSDSGKTPAPRTQDNLQAAFKNAQQANTPLDVAQKNKTLRGAEALEQKIAVKAEATAALAVALKEARAEMKAAPENGAHAKTAQNAEDRPAATTVQTVSADGSGQGSFVTAPTTARPAPEDGGTGYDQSSSAPAARQDIMGAAVSAPSITDPNEKIEICESSLNGMKLGQSAFPPLEKMEAVLIPMQQNVKMAQEAFKTWYDNPVNQILAADDVKTVPWKNMKIGTQGLDTITPVQRLPEAPLMVTSGKMTMGG